MTPRGWIWQLLLMTGCLALVLGVPSSASAQKTLAWKYSKDRVFKLVIQQDTQMKLEGIAANGLETDTQQKTYLTWTVQELKPDGTALIEQRIDRIVFDMHSAAGTFVIDTDSKEPLKGLGETVAQGIRPLAGARYTVQTKPNGEIVEVDVPKEVMGKLTNSVGNVGESTLKELAINGTLKFPDEPISVGETWPSQYEIDMRPFGKLVVSNTYQYLGEETVDGVVLDKIKLSTAVKAADPNDASGFKLRGQESSGIIWFDNAKGSIHHSDFQQDLSIDVKQNGKDIKQTIRQNVQLKFDVR